MSYFTPEFSFLFCSSCSSETLPQLGQPSTRHPNPRTRPLSAAPNLSSAPNLTSPQCCSPPVGEGLQLSLSHFAAACLTGPQPPPPQDVQFLILAYIRGLLTGFGFSLWAQSSDDLIFFVAASSLQSSCGLYASAAACLSEAVDAARMLTSSSSASAASAASSLRCLHPHVLVSLLLAMSSLAVVTGQPMRKSEKIEFNRLHFFFSHKASSHSNSINLISHLMLPHQSSIPLSLTSLSLPLPPPASRPPLLCPRHPQICPCYSRPMLLLPLLPLLLPPPPPLCLSCFACRCCRCRCPPLTVVGGSSAGGQCGLQRR